ncbi:hypothetical protein LG197_23610 [Pseudomonas asiatica]|uniref:hypothetical protein n=1 Tax=Pseudomonas asiatica TaxID=2219225 RepID=UPI0023678657|nr:hypothetical protein [Pseudomonas asiatica]WDM87562.1 hypothetical protein LG197_23610 [Pseudomonas asiatica]
MNRFGRAAVRGASALLIALSIGNAHASEFSDKVERVLSSSTIDSVSETGKAGTVVLKVPARSPDYYESGDKANKVLAIESVRIFREVPDLERLTVTLPREGKAQTLDVTRAQVEQYYKINLSELAGNPSAWREDFIQQYDNQSSRAKFVNTFATEK